jgi:adenosine deaminase
MTKRSCYFCTVPYGELSYRDFKRFAYNSITYSFLPEAEKNSLVSTLDSQFQDFEQRMNIGGN